MTRPPHRVALGDDRRRARRIAEDGQLADVVARGVPSDEPLRAIGFGADDPDGALDEDHEVVAELALADQGFTGRVDVLDRDRRDTLQVLGFETLEEGDLAKEQHRVDVGQRLGGVGHLVPSPGTSRARPAIHGSPSSANPVSTVSSSRVVGAASSRSRTSAPASDRSPLESSASIAWARVSGSVEPTQRRMTPPASGMPRTTSASRTRSIARCSRRVEDGDQERARRIRRSRPLRRGRDQRQTRRSDLGTHARAGLASSR